MPRPRLRPLTPLFRMIEAKALREQLGREELCRRFGISASYYGQLSADASLLSQASRPVLGAIAEFLDVALVQAQLWAGQIRWEDFGPRRNPGATVTQYLDAVAMQMEDDAHFREFAVPLKDWSATPQSMKLRYVALYEHARMLRLGRDSAGASVAATLARAAGLQHTEDGTSEGAREAMPRGRRRRA